MFTGIVETMGTVVETRGEGKNIHFTLESEISDELKIDQSVAHDGVCLTVVGLGDGTHTVTAIAETISKSTLGGWRESRRVNLERCVPMNGRLDGHIVQGHVDAMGKLERISDDSGSRRLFFTHAEHPDHVTVAKGSITINGVSLTVVDSSSTGFSVAIIPYTDDHTNLSSLEPGDEVNLEFDIVGKYVAELVRRGHGQ